MGLELKSKGQCETLPSSHDSGKASHPLLVSAHFSKGRIYRLQSEYAVKWSGAQICTRIWQGLNFPLVSHLREKLVVCRVPSTLEETNMGVSERPLTWPTFV